MKRILRTIVVIFITGILFTLSSYAAEDTTQWTDLKNVKVEVTQKNEDTFWAYYLKVTGVTLNENSRYYICIKSGDEQPDFTKATDKNILNNNGDMGKQLSEKLSNAYELNKDVYCYIIEEKDGKYGTPYKTKLPRLNQHSLGNRIIGFFDNPHTAIHFKEANRVEGRNIKIKVGRVTDNNILLSIKNKESNCLQKLLEYAKSSESIYTGTIPLGLKEKSITTGMNLTNKAYYYVYMIMDDENGKYYPVEDISLYQADIVGDGTEIKDLLNYLDDKFKWNIENAKTPTTNSTSQTNTVKSSNNSNTPDTTKATGKLPKTGLGIGLISLIIVTISGLIFTYFKYNNLKDI